MSQSLPLNATQLDTPESGSMLDDCLYRQLFEHTRTIKLVIDPISLTLIEANPAACTYYGYTRSEMLKCTLPQLTNLSESDLVSLIANLPEDENVSFITEQHSKQGELRYLAFELCSIQYAHKSYLYSICQDVTEHIRATSALSDSKERFRTLVDLAPVAIVQHDPQGKRLFCNSHWYELSGLNPNVDLALQPDPIHPDDVPMLAQAQRRMWDTGQRVENILIRYQQPDGAVTWGSGNGQPIYDAQGNPSGYIATIMNITELKRLEENLRASEARYRTLLELAPVGIIQLDQNGKPDYCNPRWYELVGTSPDAGLPDDSTLPIHPDDLERVTVEWMEMQTSGKAIENLRFRYCLPDQSIRWVSGDTRPILDSKGAITGYLGAITDITKPIQLEDALRTSEERFRMLFELVPFGILQTDATGKRIYCNPHWCDMLGLTLAEALEQSENQFVYPDDIETVRNMWYTMLKTKQAVEGMRFRYLRPDGSVIWAAGNMRPILDPQGRITGTLVAVNDITKRIELEDALRRSEERGRLITDNIHDVVVLTDSHNHIQFASPSIKAVFGYEPGAVIGHPLRDYIQRNELSTIAASLDSVIQVGMPNIVFETQVSNHKGHTVDVEVSAKLMQDEHGGFAGGVFALRDSTQRKLIESIMLEQEKLKSALEKETELSNIKSRMMNRIAHEFRTPLAVVQSAIENLTTYYPRFTEQQRLEKQDKIRTQIRVITNMLDDIGLVVKGTFTQAHIHRYEIDLTAICRGIANQIETNFNRPAIFLLDMPPMLRVKIDANVLKTAIKNIMHNAVLYSPPNAPVTVRLVQQSDSFELSVIDTGIGIPPNEIPRIFEPFFRGSNIGEISGLGIHLTLALAAVEAHDGSISVESTEGQGSTFTITIPLQETPEEFIPEG